MPTTRDSVIEHETSRYGVPPELGRLVGLLVFFASGPFGCLAFRLSLGFKAMRPRIGPYGALGFLCFPRVWATISLTVD
jgi:hypothetical protein